MSDRQAGYSTMNSYSHDCMWTVMIIVSCTACMRDCVGCVVAKEVQAYAHSYVLYVDSEDKDANCGSAARSRPQIKCI